MGKYEGQRPQIPHLVPETRLDNPAGAEKTGPRMRTGGFDHLRPEKFRRFDHTAAQDDEFGIQYLESRGIKVEPVTLESAS